jgi:hypothetical protein
MSTFKSDRNTPVWPAGEGEHYFRDLEIQPLRQEGPTCVSTCLAMLTLNPEELLADADSTGFVTQSHFILLHRDKIYDSTYFQCVPARDHHCVDYHTKRIFRVLPVTHARGL